MTGNTLIQSEVSVEIYILKQLRNIITAFVSILQEGKLLLKATRCSSSSLRYVKPRPKAKPSTFICFSYEFMQVKWG